jgi:hypothetical protein
MLRASAAADPAASWGPGRRREGLSRVAAGSGSDFPVFFATAVFFFKGILRLFEAT